MTSDSLTGKVKVASVQASPVFLDCDATVEKACKLIIEAGDTGARIIVFPETFIPGYPFWPRDNAGPARIPIMKAFVRYFRNSIKIDSPQVEAMCAAAKRARVYVVMGLSERDGDLGGSLYNTMLYIDPDGTVLGKHRKLVPTYGERCIWGPGDGSTLKVIPTEFGGLGGLVCYEHHMVLSRYAMMAMGERIHAAVWPAHRFMGKIVDACIRQYAFEGQVFVISSAAYMNKDMVPDWFELKEGTYWDCAGGSAIVSPLGDYLAGPVYDKEDIVCAELDFDRIIEAKLVVDSTGHYSRPDVLSLNINTEKYSPIKMAKAQAHPRSGFDLADLRELTSWANGHDGVTRDIVSLLADGLARIGNGVDPKNGEHVAISANGGTLPAR